MESAAHFVQRYPPAQGGSEAYFARLSRYLAEAGTRVTVFTTTALSLDAFWSPSGRCLPSGTATEDGVEVRRYPLWRCTGRRWLLKPLSLIPCRSWQCLTLPCNPISFPMLKDVGRVTTSFDVVHATALPYAWPMMCAWRLARRLGVPYFITPFLHLGDPDDPNDLTRRAYTSPAFLHLLSAADRVFVQTPSERDALLERGFSEEKLVLQGMGVDAAECTGGNRDTIRQTWQAEPAEVVIGHLANQSVEKGTVDLLQAAQRLWPRGRRFLLVLAGPEMPKFRRFWQSFAPAGRVIQMGVLDDRQKRDFFAGIDLFALPSRSDSFGLVLLEAWANGVPNVAYRAGGVADVIRHEIDGLLVRCGDLEALAAALERLLLDHDCRRSFGGAGRERTLHEFRWQDKLELVRQVYQQTTGGGLSSAPGFSPGGAAES